MDEKPGERRKGGAGDRAHHLLARGLELYTSGDLLGALSEWEASLALDPNLAQAQEFITYVRDNYEALDAQFRAAREAERSAYAQGVPVPQGESFDDPEAYDSLDVEHAAGYSGGEEPIEIADGLGAIDAGLDQVLDQPTHPPSRAVITQPRVLGSRDPDDDDVEEIISDDEPAALEMEAMAPDEDVPGMAPELEADEDATIDVRSRHFARGLADDVFEDLPPPGSRPGILTIQPRPPADPSLDLDLGPPTLELGATPIELDAGSTMRHEPPRVRPAPSPELSLVVPDDHEAGEGGEGDEDEATVAYDRRFHRSGGAPPATPNTRSTFSTYDPDELPTRRRPPLPRDDYVESELTSDYDESRQTRERGPFVDGDLATTARVTRSSRERAITGGAAPGPSSVIIDERLLRGAGLTPTPTGDPDRTTDFRPRTGPRDAVREAREERVRKRVTELLRQAEEAAGKGDYLKAVTAVEAATQDDDEGTITPVLLHRHRELLYRIYEGHIGDMHAVPLVAVPLHEIAGESLDHRTGFLLSRIDGMLTFEDILDVAGMPRMEAYQILSTLLRKGVIEVR